METFKRTPTIRMLAAEVRDTTVELQSGGDQYSPTIFLSPIGADVNRVLIAGTAVEKGDVGSDNSFWRVRVADPTGAIFVYAGQYQPEAAKVIQKLEVPCFVIVSGKLAHYTPEQGGDTIVSIRAESISSVNIEARDLALADISHHTVRRLQEVKKNEKVKENYPNYDYSAFTQTISTLLDQIMEEPVPAVNGTSVAPSAVPASQPVPPSTPAVTAPSPPGAPAPAAEISKPVTETSVQPPAQEPLKAPAAPKKPKRNRKKGGAKNASLDQAAKEVPKVPKEPVKESPKEAPKEAPKMGSKPNGMQDSTYFVLDILRTHKQEPGIPKDTIQNVLRALGYAMLDVDSILAKLKTAGEIIEPRDGFFRAV